MVELVVLLTCHNRKERTLKYLSSLFQILPECEVCLVDDNSTDGTSEEISLLYPAVNIIKGNGSLFLNRGIHTAWSEAVRKKY